MTYATIKIGKSTFTNSTKYGMISLTCGILKKDKIFLKI